MTPEVAVIVPVLRRPHRVEPLLRSLAQSLEPASRGRARAVFVVSQQDRASGIEARRYREHADCLVAPWRPAAGDYARKINLAFRQTDAEFVFVGADDLRFHPGWLEAALAVFDQRDVGVVGTNDLGRRARHGHSTHSLVCRGYVELWGGTADGTGDVYCELYDHQYVDDELIACARGRGCYAFAAGSVVEHLHPFHGKAAMDDTYRKALRAGDADRRLFRQRSRLWNGRPATARAAR